jgi:cytochrome c oxidase subunit 2
MAIFISCVVSATAGNTQHFDVTAKRFSYEPAQITVKRDQPVTIAVHSLDAHHGLKFKDFNVDVDVPKGQTKELSFTPKNTGTFVGVCSHFCGRGHGEMKLMVVVTE